MRAARFQSSWKRESLAIVRNEEGVDDPGRLSGRRHLALAVHRWNGLFLCPSSRPLQSKGGVGSL